MPDCYDPYTGEWADVDPADMEDHLEYLRYQEDRSVEKKCERCGDEVFLPEDYAICGRCADAVEAGLDG